MRSRGLGRLSRPFSRVCRFRSPILSISRRVSISAAVAAGKATLLRVCARLRACVLTHNATSVVFFAFRSAAAESAACNYVCRVSLVDVDWVWLADTCRVNRCELRRAEGPPWLGCVSRLSELFNKHLITANSRRNSKRAPSFDRSVDSVLLTICTCLNDRSSSGLGQSECVVWTVVTGQLLNNDGKTRL